jgi:hypothetical protein
MTDSNDSSSSRYVIWLPICQPSEVIALERVCRDAVTGHDGQVVGVFHNDADRLLAALKASEVDTVVYPHHGPVVRDSLLSGIVHGVFLGLFRVSLRCADDPSFLAVPHAFVRLAQGVIVNHLQSFYAQPLPPVGDHLPLGYRLVGKQVEIDPDQARQVRDLFAKFVGDG